MEQVVILLKKGGLCNDLVLVAYRRLHCFLKFSTKLYLHVLNSNVSTAKHTSSSLSSEYIIVIGFILNTFKIRDKHKEMSTKYYIYNRDVILRQTTRGLA